jgi:hypothetical protein
MSKMPMSNASRNPFHNPDKKPLEDDPEQSTNHGNGDARPDDGDDKALLGNGANEASLTDGDGTGSNGETSADKKTDQPPPPRKHWNAASLRVDPEDESTPGAKPLLLRVPVEKPNPQDFVRVRPEPQHRAITYILEVKEKRETYVVVPAVARMVLKEVKKVELRICVNLNGAVRLWPVPMPKPDEKSNAYNESHRAAAEEAEKDWVRVWSDGKAAQYVAEAPIDEQPPPRWPDQTLDDLIDIAFKGRIIDSIDHPVLKALRGQR